MHKPGSILLIACYELGHQPLGVASPMAFLERAGFQPACLDLSVERLDPVRVAQARLVAISVPMHTALRIGVEIGRRVRAANPQAHLVYHGLYATLNADYLLSEGCSDSVMSGECEAALVALARRLEAMPVDGETPDAHPPPILERLDHPVPSRAALPDPGRYAHLLHGSQRIRAGYVEATRGCLHLCRHCPIPPIYNGRFFVVPGDVVLADIDQQVQRGARHLTFGDPDFLNGPGHVMSVVRAMHETHPQLTFDITVKVEHILKHRKLFPELAGLGCLFAVSAVESLSDTVLVRLDKGHTRADIDTALEILRGAGIAMRPTLVPFTPWTTAEDYLELFDFVESRYLIDSIDPIQLGLRLLLPPGSLLLDEPSIQPSLGALDQPGFTVRWTHPDARMDTLHGEIARLLERESNTDPMITFYALRELACRRLGRVAPDTPLFAPRSERRAAPRLSEDWFC